MIYIHITMPSQTLQEIVRKSVAYMQANIRGPLKIEEIARNAICSQTQLRRAFGQVTGRSPIDNLLELRIAGARELLRQTQMSIEEVAEAVGFNQASYFWRVFRRLCGLSPRAFRNTSRKTGDTPGIGAPVAQRNEPREWFRDPANSSFLGKWWRPLSGQWQQHNNAIWGKGTGGFELALDRPTPENFRICFEVCFRPEKGFLLSDLNVMLRDQSMKRVYMEFVIGGRSNTTAECRPFRRVRHFNPAGIIKPDTWHRVEMELLDQSMRFCYDGDELFRISDPFPPPYNARCIFVVGGYRCSFCFRELEVFDLGFSPIASIIRQGDALFDAGLFDRANAFYQRHLSATRDIAQTMELRHKIGMCHLRQSSFARARDWFSKVVPCPQNQSWSQWARIAELESDWREDDLDMFKERAVTMFADPSLRDHVREQANAAFSQLGSRGFHKRAVKLMQQLMALEAPNSLPLLFARSRIAAGWQDLARTPEVEAVAVEQCRAPGGPPDLVYQARRILVMALLLQRKWDRAKEIIAAMRADAEVRSQELGWAVDRAFLLRAQGKYKQAISEFEGINRGSLAGPAGNPFADLQIIYLLTGMGKLAEALDFVQTRRQNRESSRYFVPRSRSEYIYAPYFADGRYAHCASLFLEGPDNPPQLVEHAARSVLAGIMLELSGEPGKAYEEWSRTLRRFPPERVHWYPNFAKRLMNAEDDQLEDMPFRAWTRSEFMYVVSILWEKRGNTKRAQELLEMCVKEDATNRWPACLAKRKLLP